MPLYLTKFSYTPETWARLIGNPEDRRDAARTYIESVGGKLHGFWYGFGTHDGHTLWEAPDNVSMAAVALAITRWRCTQLARDHRAHERRRYFGRATEGGADPVPGAGRPGRPSRLSPIGVVCVLEVHAEVSPPFERLMWRPMVSRNDS